MKIVDDYIHQMKTVYLDLGLLITIHNKLPKYSIDSKVFKPLDKIDFEQLQHTYKTLHDQLAYEYGIDFE